MESEQKTETRVDAPPKRRIDLEWFTTAELFTLRVFVLTKLLVDVGEILFKSFPR